MNVLPVSWPRARRRAHDPSCGDLALGNRWSGQGNRTLVVQLGMLRTQRLGNPRRKDVAMAGIGTSRHAAVNRPSVAFGA